MRFDIPQSEFVPHPHGIHKGTIVDVTDQGERESTFEGKTRIVQKVSIDIESSTAFTDDGRPFVHREWCTLSSDERSKLLKLRQSLLKRPVTEDEKMHFDPDKEMIGRQVEYVIEHVYRNGKTHPGIASWSLLRSDDAARTSRAVTTHSPAPVDEADAQPVIAHEGQAPPREEAPPPTDEDLPF